MNWDWEKLQEKRQRQSGSRSPFEGKRPDNDGKKPPFEKIDLRKVLPKFSTGIPLFPVILIIVVVWLASGIFIVSPGEVGVVTRFGEFNRTVGAGPHYRFPFPIEQNMLVNVQILRTVTLGQHSTIKETSVDDSTMFTGDENIIHMHFNVQYNLISMEGEGVAPIPPVTQPEETGAMATAEEDMEAVPSVEGEDIGVVAPRPFIPIATRISDEKTHENARKYLFNIKEPDRVVSIAAEAAMREVVGSSRLDNILKFERDIIQNQARTVLQAILDNFYDGGIRIQAVQLLDVQPPVEVADNYKDIASAREDMERMINEAQAYQVSIERVAKGTAISIKNEAGAYSQTIIRQALGETGRFLALVEEYKKAPSITEKRLRLETLQEVLSSPTIEKVLLNSAAGGYLPFLNLDRGAVKPVRPVSPETAQGGAR